MRPVIGQKFERLTVLSFCGYNQHRMPYWNVRCDCGIEKAVRQYDLSNGTIRSCGCLQREWATKNGKANPPPVRSGSESANWKERPDYQAAHVRVRVARGKASELKCACGLPAHEWSYDGDGGPSELVNEQGQRYSTDVMEYVARCRSCHRNKDGVRVMREERDLWRARAIALGWVDNGAAI